MLDRPPSRQAQRRARRAAQQCRHRARERAGRACYQIELCGEVIDWLIRTRWLDQRQAGDRTEVGRAIEAMLQDAAKNNP
jgi:hypothetical protein